jgi:hypothetical protein
LAEVLAPEPVDDDLLVALRPGPVNVRDEGERCALVTPDRVVSVPARARRALEAIVGTEGPLRVGDLSACLDDASRVVLVTRLLRDGVLRRA